MTMNCSLARIKKKNEKFSSVTSRLHITNHLLFSYLRILKTSTREYRIIISLTSLFSHCIVEFLNFAEMYIKQKKKNRHTRYWFMQEWKAEDNWIETIFTLYIMGKIENYRFGFTDWISWMYVLLFMTRSLTSQSDGSNLTNWTENIFTRIHRNKILQEIYTFRIFFFSFSYLISHTVCFSDTVFFFFIVISGVIYFVLLVKRIGINSNKLYYY